MDADAAMNNARQAELALQAEILAADVNDTNYIFPHFILNYVPIGLIGLIIAGIFAAAMSSIDSQLNALSTVSIVDWYQRLDQNKHGDIHYLKYSRWTTLGWGIFATISALALGETRSIIELVNQIGSYFYGSIFRCIYALTLVKKSQWNWSFSRFSIWNVCCFIFDRLFYSEPLSDYSFFFPWTQMPETYTKAVEFLWLNPVGAITVVMVGVLVSMLSQTSNH